MAKISPQYQTSIVLSHLINPDLSLSDQTRKRTDHGIELFSQGTVASLTFAGGRAQNSIPYTHALAMKNYALAKGVPVGAILMEEHSMDTVGQALFTKRAIVVPRNWGNLIVISQEYHIPRAKRIFDFVYGKEFDISFHAVQNDCEDPDMLECQQRSLEAFLSTFKGVEAGKDDDILVRLYKAQPLYNGVVRR